MYHVSAQGVDERMINGHYYYYYWPGKESSFKNARSIISNGNGNDKEDLYYNMQIYILPSKACSCKIVLHNYC